jgi:hypothetical protein
MEGVEMWLSSQAYKNLIPEKTNAHSGSDYVEK